MLHHILIISDGGFVAGVFSAMKERGVFPNVEVLNLGTFSVDDQGINRLAQRPSLIVVEVSDQEARDMILNTISISSALKDIPLIQVQASTQIDHMKILQSLHQNQHQFDSQIVDSIDHKEMILIPAGTYKRRKGISQEYLRKNGDHQDEANTGAFYIDKYAVTNLEYQRFLAATGYLPPAVWLHGVFQAGKENHPVTGICWEDVLAYADWAGKLIPSLDEWEKAAFGSEGLNFPWGNDFDPSRCNVAEAGIGETTPVDQYDARGGCSSFGVSGMIGNVWEWVYDWISSPNNRVLCGGAWDTPQAILVAPNYARVRAHPDLRGGNFGFRLILPLEKYFLRRVAR
jgi:formylglycine-generating enzyme required for sulfatase activity